MQHIIKVKDEFWTHLNTAKKKNMTIITGANVTKVNLESNSTVSIDNFIK